MKSTLPIKIPLLAVDKDELLSFENTLLMKDFSVKKIKEKLPELSFVIDHLIGLVPIKRYITVDVMKHNFKNEGNTCRDGSFHIDGLNNNYAMWVIGDFRTEFLMEEVFIDGLGSEKPIEINPKLKYLIDDTFHKIQEIDESTPFVYDSRCIHRGRVAAKGSKRILVRVCSSDYIRPKNVDLLKANKMEVTYGT
jgi:hypothetical protein